MDDVLAGKIKILRMRVSQIQKMTPESIQELIRMTTLRTFLPKETLNMLLNASYNVTEDVLRGNETAMYLISDWMKREATRSARELLVSMVRHLPSNHLADALQTLTRLEA